jgi:hypothetical protein
MIPVTGPVWIRTCRLARFSPFARRILAKSEKLLLMMPSMHETKLSPLCSTQRTQNGMVEELYVALEAGFTLRDNR